MNKNELIDYITGINCDNFTITRELQKPTVEHALPDMRTGAIYPPIPMVQQHYKEYEKLTLHITGVLNE